MLPLFHENSELKESNFEPRYWYEESFALPIALISSLVCGLTNAGRSAVRDLSLMLDGSLKYPFTSTCDVPVMSNPLSSWRLKNVLTNFWIWTLLETSNLPSLMVKS